jgi:hypothetical protein
LDNSGQPTRKILEERRDARFITPSPNRKNKGKVLNRKALSLMKAEGNYSPPRECCPQCLERMGALALAGFPDGANDAERLGSADGQEAACDLQFNFDWPYQSQRPVCCRTPRGNHGNPAGKTRNPNRTPLVVPGHDIRQLLRVECRLARSAGHLHRLLAVYQDFTQPDRPVMPLVGLLKVAQVVQNVGVAQVYTRCFFINFFSIWPPNDYQNYPNDRFISNYLEQGCCHFAATHWPAEI